MFSREIESMIFDPKRCAINLYNCPSFDVYFEKKWRYFSLLEKSALEGEPSALNF